MMPHWPDSGAMVRVCPHGLQRLNPKRLHAHIMTVATLSLFLSLLACLNAPSPLLPNACRRA